MVRFEIRMVDGCAGQGEVQPRPRVRFEMRLVDRVYFFAEG